jgi:hypothetical protein
VGICLPTAVCSTYPKCNWSPPNRSMQHLPQRGWLPQNLAQEWALPHWLAAIP